MDNGKGYFEEIDRLKFEDQKKESKSMVFQVGEILEIRGSLFRVDKILRNKLHLKLLKQLS